MPQLPKAINKRKLLGTSGQSEWTKRLRGGGCRQSKRLLTACEVQICDLNQTDLGAVFLDSSNGLANFAHEHCQPLLTVDHPYFVTVGDNPGTLLVFAPLTLSTDYHSWARSMRMSLLSKNKFGFVDGTVTPAAPSDVLYSC
ncbi:hypothetical protein LINGRAHAP2_LOCUS19605 [Linum grandiflorum]